ncbi:MAG: tetratricopeptide repeat protein [Bryobacterales bacterium]|nr:tetratricopeptide repeat protein [Bryobacterales bacterium]
MSSRATALRALLEQDPKNSFARYGLALDYANNGDLETAVAEFRNVLANDPNYCAAYYHGGQTLEKLGRPADAATLYRDGIEATKRTGDAHTRSEIEAALSLLG